LPLRYYAILASALWRSFPFMRGVSMNELYYSLGLVVFELRAFFVIDHPLIKQL